eukprot:gb/GECG01009164.1/.p1 GENE.gb/GECG01009164.1/~~gb/GECG01009164.1/.p1  ORF type:complete len:280 (+),score=21.10 gb/GECG01009164.1/:1-840(+)
MPFLDDARIQEVERLILEWGNPDLPLELRETRGWWMTSLNECLLAMSIYSVVVILGLILQGANIPKIPDGLDKAIKVIQTVYNLVQVALCAYMIFITVREAFVDNQYTLVCNEFKPTSRGDMARAVWIFYLSKMLDFMDTVFIVLRQKWNQLSFLHIYHHFSIFFIYWMNTNVAYDGDIYYTVIANSFVHLVMYWYYFQSSVGTKPWWARYLTQLQMVQFITMMTQGAYIVVQGCPFPRNITAFYLVYIFSLLLLFLSFYLKRYSSQERKSLSKGTKEE